MLCELRSFYNEKVFQNCELWFAKTAFHSSCIFENGTSCWMKKYYRNEFISICFWRVSYLIFCTNIFLTFMYICITSHAMLNEIWGISLTDSYKFFFPGSPGSKTSCAALGFFELLLYLFDVHGFWKKAFVLVFTSKLKKNAIDNLHLLPQTIRFLVFYLP